MLSGLEGVEVVMAVVAASVVSTAVPRFVDSVVVGAGVADSLFVVRRAVDGLGVVGCAAVDNLGVVGCTDNLGVGCADCWAMVDCMDGWAVVDGVDGWEVVDGVDCWEVVDGVDCWEVVDSLRDVDCTPVVEALDDVVGMYGGVVTSTVTTVGPTCWQELLR